MKKYLITGCEGFIGSHLADFLVERNLPVYAMVYGDIRNIKHLNDTIEILPCDLRDKEKVNEIINRVKPDIVVHLAAQSFVTVSWQNPEETLRTNVLGTFYLLESIRKAGIAPTIAVVGSSAIYGPCGPNEMPLTEEREFRPTSMYGVSKVSEEVMGYFYFKAYGMKIIRVRPFNMTGPRKTDDACSDFSKGIVEVEKGSKKTLEVGNLNAIRDFTDGRDVANALWIMIEKGESGAVYNLCSGTGYKMDEILRKLLSLSTQKVEFRISQEKMRLVDDPIYVGDNSKLMKLGWRPELTIEKTLSDMLQYWRANISAG